MASHTMTSTDTYFIITSETHVPQMLYLTTAGSAAGPAPGGPARADAGEVESEAGQPGEHQARVGEDHFAGGGGGRVEQERDEEEESCDVTQHCRILPFGSA